MTVGDKNNLKMNENGKACSNLFISIFKLISKWVTYINDNDDYVEKVSTFLILLNSMKFIFVFVNY